MKKSILPHALVLILCFATTIRGTFALNRNNETPKSKRAATLHQHFPSATHIIWYEETNSFSAYYTFQHEKAISHFSKTGDLMFTLIYRQTNELPVNIHAALSRKYQRFKITNVEEYLSNDIHYYSILMESKTQLISVKADDEDIEIVQKLNKA